MKTLLVDVENFGEIAAEDDDLRRYFVKTPVFSELLRGQKQVVIGRKGSGKTALYKGLLEKEGGHSASGLTFKDYPWALHYRYQSQLGDRYERFVASWKFLVLLEASKLFLADPQKAERGYSREQKRSLNSLEAFITSNWGALDFDYKKTFPRGGLRVSSIEVNPQVAGIGLGGVELERGGGLGDSLTRLNDWILECLKSLGTDSPKAYILFDELDSGFDPGDADYVDRVTGILLAVRSLAKTFRDASLKIYPIAFLRSDIFDSLHFGDKNKLIERNVITLQWHDHMEKSGASLKEMIDHRIARVLALPSSKNADAWDMAFDDRLMPGTQHKFAHITFRTYLRPRDVIKFCNCALDAAKERIGTSGGSPLITNDDMHSARRAYSLYLKQELDDEISASAPDWQDCLTVLRRIGKGKFEADEFQGAFARIRETAAIRLGQIEALRLMYRYSIIGFQRIGRTERGGVLLPF